MKLVILLTFITIALCSPTSDKLDFRHKTEQYLQKCSKDQIQQLTKANLDVLIAAMRLQGMKYRYFHGLDIIDNFYNRIIDKTEKYLPVAFAVFDTYVPDNVTFNHFTQYVFCVSFEEYRYMGEKLDISRKNLLEVSDTTEVLGEKFKNIQDSILKAILWASDYLRYKKLDTFWGSLHIQIHDLVADEFNKLNSDLDKLPSNELKSKALQVLIEEISILLI